MQLEMAVDIFHHHDSIVNQDADGEDQGKQGDPVQGIAVKIVDQEGESQGHRHSYAYYQCFTPAKGKGNEDDDRNSGNKHMLQEFIGFFLGCFTVIPCYRYLQVRWDQFTLEGLHLCQGFMGNSACVGAFFLGNGNGYRLKLAGCRL